MRYSADLNDKKRYSIRRKLISSLLGSILSICLVTIPVHAIPTTYNMGVPITVQPNNFWCWAACGTATVNYYGGNISQSAFCYAAKGSVVIATATASEVCTGLTHFGLTNHLFTGTLSYSDIQLNSYSFGRPIIAGLKPTAGSTAGAHMVVITGYTTVSGGTNQVILMNPANYSYQYVNYSYLLSNSTRYWYETIDQIY